MKPNKPCTYHLFKNVFPESMLQQKQSLKSHKFNPDQKSDKGIRPLSKILNLIPLNRVIIS